MFFSNITRGVVLVIAFMLTLGGCGGGSKAPYEVSPKSLTFVGIVSPETTPPSQTITVTVNELTYLAVACTAASYIATCNWAITGPKTAEIYVYVISAVSAGAGNHTGAQVVVVGCKDVGCAQPHSNSPQFVDVTYNVSPTFAFQEQQTIQEIPVYPGTKGFGPATLVAPEDAVQDSQIQPVADPAAVMQRLGITQ